MSIKDLKKKKQNKRYFNEDTEQAVIDFLNAKTPQEKNKIFNNHLHYPCYKLVEGIINKYQLYSKTLTFDELHVKMMSYLISKMDRYDPTKGYKAYSYYGTIVVRELITLKKKESKNINKHVEYDDSFKEDERFSYQIEEQDTDGLMIQAFETIASKIEVVLKENEEKDFLKEEERRMGVAILEVMSNRDKIFTTEDDSNGNKKYEKNKILMCLREITGFSTKDIRKYSKRFKNLYYECKEEILENY